jgi:hypothetical protein
MAPAGPSQTHPLLYVTRRFSLRLPVFWLTVGGGGVLFYCFTIRLYNDLTIRMQPRLWKYRL